VASFGTRLKEERERRKVSLDEISMSTKISSRLLNALEEDHFELLPGGIFNKGFIRAYAQHLGLDEDQVIAEYLEAAGMLPPDAKPDSSLATPVADIHAEAYAEDGPTLPWGLFAVILLIVALTFAVWGFYSRQTATGGKPPSPKQTGAASAPEVPVNAPASSDSASTASSGGAVPGHAAMTPVSAGMTPNSAARAVGGSSTTTAAPSAIRVHITARKDAWVSITADGKRILQDTLSSSAEKSVQAAKEITVKAGNIAALDLEWNGKKLPPQGSEGEVVTLNFDANGWHIVPKPAAPPEAPAPATISPSPL
jgi:cytoskeleton protein RodZ